MSSTATSIGQTKPSVNTRDVLYYSANVKQSVLDGQRRATPTQTIAINQRAAQLRAQDAILLAGPVKVGGMIRVPSWRSNPELVRTVKSMAGYRFNNELPYTLDIALGNVTYTTSVTMPTWTVPDAPGRLEQIRGVYEYVFSREIAAAKISRQNEALGRI